MVQPLLEISGLSCRYGPIQALSEVDATVSPGELVGLLGPNGAGKTTLIRCAVGLERPFGGRVLLGGWEMPAQAGRARPLLGYMPQVPSLYGDLTAMENVVFFGSAFLPDRQELRERARELLAMLDLSSAADLPVGRFSGGMQGRVSLACALVHRPRMLFLDEPTAGVDPLVSQRIWSHLRALVKEGTAVLLSTHLLEEVYNCTRVLVLSRGRILAHDTPEGLVARGQTQVEILADGETTRFRAHDLSRELPGLLRPWGLSPVVARIRIRPPTVQEALVDLYGKVGE